MVRRVLRIALAVPTIVASVGAGAAAARPLHVIVQRADFFGSDGERYALWGNDYNDYFTVLDTVSHRRYRLAKPRGCATDYDQWADKAYPSGGRALFFCGRGLNRVIDLRTGQITSPPSVVAVPDGELRDVFWFAIGRRWLGGSDGQQRLVYLDLVTGETRVLASGTVVDLDQPTLTPVEACPALSERANALLGAAHPGPRRSYWQGPGLLLEDRYMLDARRNKVGERLLLHGCTGKPRTLARGTFSRARVAGGFVSWDTGFDPRLWVDQVRRHPGALHLYSPTSGRTLSWRLPFVSGDLGDGPVRGDFGLSWHTRREVFWAAVTNQTTDGYTTLYPRFRVFAAPVR